MWQQLIDNPLCWIMMLVAWVAYIRVFLHHFGGTQALVIENVLIGALPLMGLLGTILGLQSSFVGMMREGVESQVVSAGIADALVTTQFGLILAIPGWLALSFLGKRDKEFTHG